MPNTATFRCPWCFAMVTATGEPEYTVDHALPTCKRFEEMDVLEYMTAARKAMGIPEPGAA